MKEFQGGKVHVANRVIDLIIASAADKVDGVAEVKGFSREERLCFGASKYIETVVEGRELKTSLFIRVDESTSIIKTVEEVQKNVKEQVESMLGLRCTEVNITVI